ncbi:hypothetical protein D3C73_964220 [compost metagenome]
MNICIAIFTYLVAHSGQLLHIPVRCHLVISLQFILRIYRCQNSGNLPGMHSHHRLRTFCRVLQADLHHVRLMIFMADIENHGGLVIQHLLHQPANEEIAKNPSQINRDQHNRRPADPGRSPEEGQQRDQQDTGDNHDSQRSRPASNHNFIARMNQG